MKSNKQKTNIVVSNLMPDDRSFIVVKKGEVLTSATDKEKIKKYFSQLGKKSWSKRRKDILS